MALELHIVKHVPLVVGGLHTHTDEVAAELATRRVHKSKPDAQDAQLRDERDLSKHLRVVLSTL